MLVAMDRRAAQPAAVDDARVVQAVAQHRILRTDQATDRPDVREIAAAEDECGLRSLEVREFLLQRGVPPVRADDQSRRGRAASPARRACRRVDDRGMTRESEVVVGRQIEEPAAALGDNPAAVALERPQRSEKSRVVSPRELVGEKRVPGGGYNAHSSISKPRSEIIR